MLYAPLAVTRLVAAVFICRPYAAKPIAVSGCQGCPKGTTGAERKEPGLDAGASGDYRAWPSKDGKPQRLDAGQRSGFRAAPIREGSPAVGSLPQHPDRRTQPGSKRPLDLQSAPAWQGFGGAEPPKGAPDHASPARRERARAARAMLLPTSTVCGELSTCLTMVLQSYVEFG